MAASLRTEPTDAPAPLDRWVQHPQGRLFTRTWQPAAAGASSPTPAAPAPIVLFHDSLGSVALWRDFPSRLSEATGRAVIAYDRLGFGQSDRREGRPSLAFVAEEAGQFFPLLREQLGLSRFVALGHSVGGGMAVHCAADFADDCEALVTIAAQAFAEDRTLEGIRAARDLFQDPAQVDRLARYHGDKTAWVLDAWIGNWLHPRFAEWSIDAALPRVRCPVLAIHGELDEYGSTVHPKRIVAGVSGPAQALILPGVAHVPHREQPGTVLQAISDFLRQR